MMGALIQGLMAKNVSHQWIRHFANCWPPFVASAVSVDRISADMSEIDVSMKLRWHNSNFAGSQSGGLLYAMVDPFHVFMLSQKLGPGYVVWDKTARIQFLRPGRSRVFAHFRLAEKAIAALRIELEDKSRAVFETSIEILDEKGGRVAVVDKQLSIKSSQAKRG